MVEIRLKKKAAVRVGYRMDPDKKSAIMQTLIKRGLHLVSNNHSSRLRSFKKYHCCHKEDICLLKKAMYILPQPKPTVKDMYLKDIQLNLAGNFEPISMLRGSFNYTQV